MPVDLSRVIHDEKTRPTPERYAPAGPDRLAARGGIARPATGVRAV